MDGELAKQLSAAYRHRFTMSDLEGLSVGDDVLRYFNRGLYDTKNVKRYRLVHIPQQQGGGVGSSLQFLAWKWR